MLDFRRRKIHHPERDKRDNIAPTSTLLPPLSHLQNNQSRLEMMMCIMIRRTRISVVLLWMLALLVGLSISYAQLIDDDEEVKLPSWFQRPFYRKMQDRYFVESPNSLNLHETLPLGTYTVGFDPMFGQYYLKEIQPFQVTHKLYGTTIEHTNRILKTYYDRSPDSTGVLLAGEKGSGKTLLAKYISIMAAENGNISTIVINEPLSGEKFNEFIQSIQQPAVILFDEFEKTYRMPVEGEMAMKKAQAEGRMYDRHHLMINREEDDYFSNPSQDAILTLLDGVYPSNMLFILTVNDKKMITKHMNNRPGRLFYVIDFHGVDSNFIREYCMDRLKNKDHISSIVSVASVFDAFSFDMLQALVEEMNRYNQTTTDALQWLNVRLETAKTDSFLVRELTADGKNILDLTDPFWTGNVMKGPIRFTYYSESRRNWFGGSSVGRTIQFSPARHLVSGNITSGVYEFKDPDRRNSVILEMAFEPDALSVAETLVF